MFIITYKKIFLLFSLALTGAALALILVFGLNFGIDFTGGALTTVHYDGGRPAKADLETSLTALNIGELSLREAGEDGYLLRTRDLTEAERTAVVGAFGLGGTASPIIDQYTSIGPTVGKELRNKGLIGLAVVMLSIVIYIAIAFRAVTEPVPSWKYGSIAIVTLVHDIVIPLGVFALLGHYLGTTIDTLFLTALLVILGYSVNDTIIIFDRIRENLRLNKEGNKHEDFEQTVGKSLSQTYARSINTSLTVLITLFAIYFFGGHSTESFALALILGVAAGAYSSIFIAAPLLVVLANVQGKPEAKLEKKRS